MSDISRVRPGDTLVKAFNGVMMTDLQYAIDNAEEAAEILHKAVPAQDVDSAKGEVEKMGPYVKSALAGKPIDTLDPTKAARGVAMLQGAGSHACRPDSRASRSLRRRAPTA